MQQLTTANTFASQNGNVLGWEYAFGKIVDDYSGGVYNPYWGALGAMVFHGGGHAATFDNSVVLLDYNDLRFKRLSNPTQPDLGLNWLFAAIDPAFSDTYCEYGDGQPGSAHTYDALAILPPADGGAALGSLLRVGSYGVHPILARNTAWVHRFDFGATSMQGGKWTRGSSNGLKTLNPGACSAYDGKRRRVWTIAQLSWLPQFVRYFDVASREVREVAFVAGAAAAPTASPDSATLRYLPGRDLLVLSCTVNGALVVAYLQCAAPEKGWYRASLSATIPVTDGASCPFDHVPEADKLVMLSGSDTAAVYDIMPPTDPTKVWTVVRQPLGGLGVLRSAHVVGKRWSYSPATRCFVWMASSNSGVVAYRPVGV